MRRSPLTVLVLAIAMLALPAVSLAQSAGDNQYNDPLAGQHGGSGHSGSKGSGGSTSTPAPATAPATQTPAATSAGTTGSQQTSAARSQLPRTGFDVILTIELGIALLLTGVVVQRLVVLRERRELR
jgi:hypothetical protein